MTARRSGRRVVGRARLSTEYNTASKRKAFSLSRAFTSEISIYHSTTRYFRKQFKVIHYEIQMLLSVAATTSPS